MDKLFSLLISICFCSAFAKIEIKELKVPQSIEYGSVSDVILDCDFDGNGENGIEVKWFLNDNDRQIYQWIPETNGPGQAVGQFKDNIDVSYKISNDRNSMYRALHILNPTPKMTGNYTCKVSGDTSEAIRTKSMIIYEPAQDGLDLVVSENESLIICSASGIYPRPNMTIYLVTSNGTELGLVQDEDTVVCDQNPKQCNISSFLQYDPDNITNPFEYVCELNIPGTTYGLRELRTHYLSNVEIETQIEEDYDDLLEYSDNTAKFIYNETQENYTTMIEDYVIYNNIINSTESSSINMQVDDNTTIETQIEEDIVNITDSSENNILEVNESFPILPNIHLLISTLLLLIMVSTKIKS